MESNFQQAMAIQLACSVVMNTCQIVYDSHTDGTCRCPCTFFVKPSVHVAAYFYGKFQGKLVYAHVASTRPSLSSTSEGLGGTRGYSLVYNPRFVVSVCGCPHGHQAGKEG